MTGVERTQKEKTCEKAEQLRMRKEKNTGKVIDENMFLGDSNEHSDPSKRFVSPSPSPVLFAIYTPSEKTLWVSIDDCNAGNLYEYDFKTQGPINTTIIPGKNSTPLTAIEMM
jgi:hypothetical protein